MLNHVSLFIFSCKQMNTFNYYYFYNNMYFKNKNNGPKYLKLESFKNVSLI